MDSLWIALLAKPFLGIAYVALLLVSTKLIATLLFVLLPDCRLKRALFRGWDGYGSGRSAKKRNRVLDKLPFLKR